MSNKFDIVLWGATGFTGQLVAEYLAGNAAPTVRWAIAGRNQDKLAALRQRLTAVNPALSDLPILLGDSLDRKSLDKIVAQSRVVCATVGPYTTYGTPLVAACVEQGVAYCDLTGETNWVRANIDAFHAQAQQTGARIVHFCGFDSIPSDLGTLMVQEYAQRKYARSCQSVKHIFVAFKGGASGGTIASMMTLLEEAAKDKSIRRLLANPYALVPDREPDWSHADQMSARYDPDIRRWTGPFIMAMVNSRVVRRSNALLGYPYGRDFRFTEMSRFGKGVNGRIQATAFALGFQAGMATMAVGPIRKLLQTTVLPDPGEGPSREARESGYFRTILLGKIPDANSDAETWIKGTVIGRNDPGYGETAKMLGESALCLALDDVPQQGGILTPAAAMGMPLVERLRAAGMTFGVGPWAS